MQPPTASHVEHVRRLLRKVDDGFAAARAALSERKQGDLDKTLDEMDATLNSAGEAFKRGEAEQAEDLLLNAMIIARRIAGIRNQAEQREVETLLTETREQIELAVRAIEEMVVNTKALADRAFRKTARKVAEPPPPPEDAGEYLRQARASRKPKTLLILLAAGCVLFVVAALWSSLR